MELLHHRLGQRSTRSLLAADTGFFWQDIELKVDPDTFYISCQISIINKKAISKTPLKSNTSFKWAFIDITPAISYKILSKETNSSNYLLIVDAYSKIPKCYWIENITTQEVMDKLDMFQARFGKLMNLFGVIWREFKLGLACSLPPRSFSKIFLYMEYN